MTSPDIHWQHVFDFDSLEAIWRDWDDAVTRSDVETLFNSSTWLKLWLKNYWQKNWQLAVKVAWYQGRIVAILPLYVQPNTSTAFPIGQGESEETEVASEYLDVIAESQWHNELAAPIRTFIQKSASQLKWKALLHNAFLLKILRNETLRMSQASRYITHTVQYSDQNLSRNTRSQHNRAMNKLAKNYAFRMRWASHVEFPALFEKLRKLHEMRWHQAGKPGAFGSKPFNQFHRQLLTQSDFTAISVLDIDEEPIAINYYLKGDDTLYFYQSGWDIKKYKQVSPGLLLHCWSLQNSVHSFYDFMMGSSKKSYKSKYSTTATDMHSIYFPISTAAKFKFYIYRAVQTIRKLK